jgi:hypothetical protein
MPVTALDLKGEEVPTRLTTLGGPDVTGFPTTTICLNLTSLAGKDRPKRKTNAAEMPSCPDLRAEASTHPTTLEGAGTVASPVPLEVAVPMVLNLKCEKEPTQLTTRRTSQQQ